MKLIHRLGTLLLLLFSFHAHAEDGVANLKNGVALKGNDPVSYFKSNTPTLGLESIQTKVGEATYWFTNESNKQEFNKNPKKYEPQFGGWCAYAVADSKSKVDVAVDNFHIQDGRLLLFYKSFFTGNTKDDWLDPKGIGEKEFLKKADANWPETKGKKP